MTLTEYSIRANAIYWLVRVGPILAWFWAFSSLLSWISLTGYIVLALCWYRAIWVILHRLGLDLLLLRLELLTDMDMILHLCGILDECELIVTSCVKMDSPDDL